MSIRFLTISVAILVLASCKSKPVGRCVVGLAPPIASTQPAAPATQPAATQPAPISPAAVARADHLASVVASNAKTETEKVEACYALEMMGTSAASASEALAEALREPDPVRFHAGRALVAIGPAAIPAIKSVMASGPLPIRYAAADAWAQIDIESGVSEADLKNRLENGRPIDRVEAAVALQGVRDRQMMQAILTRSANRSRNNARGPEQSTATESPATAIEKLIAVAEATKEPVTQVDMLKTLARYGVEASLIAARITPFLDSSSAEVVDSAAQTLRAIGPSGTTQLTIALKSKKGSARLAAAKALDANSPVATDATLRKYIIAALGGVLNDDAPGVRTAAAASLCTYGADAREALLRGMKDGDDSVNDMVIDQILLSPIAFVGPTDADHPSAVALDFARRLAPDFLVRMKKPDFYMRWRVAVALSYMPDEAVHTELSAALRMTIDPAMSGFTLADAKELIDQLGPAGLPVLVDAADTGNDAFRWLAITTLAARSQAMGNPKMLSAMTTAMSDPSPKIRQAAFAWVRKLPSPSEELMSHIAPLVADADPRFHVDIDDRIAAAGMLGRFPFNPPRSVKVLSDALDTDSPDLKLACVVALRAYGSDARPAAVRLGKIVAADVEPLAREAADTILGCGPEQRRTVADYFTRRLATASDRAVVPSLIRSIAQIGPDAAGAVPALQKCLADPDNGLRIEVADALAAIGPEARAAVPALSRMADNSSADVRRSAASALIKICPDGKGLAPALLAAVYNGDRTYAARISGVLQQTGNTKALLTRLEDLAANDPDAIVRAAARQAVQSLSAGSVPSSTTQPKG